MAEPRVRQEQHVPSTKVLKGVVRALAESFASSLNRRKGDFVIAHLYRAAQQHRIQDLRFHIDVLHAHGEPRVLAIGPVKEAIDGYTGWLEDLLTRSGSSPSLVTEASLTINMKVSRAEVLGLRLPRWISTPMSTPFRCSSVIRDIRGRSYTHDLTDIVSLYP